MREIKFRGMRDDTKEWIYWSGINGHGLKYNYPLPETVGQFTGLYDKNGKEIYSGDIVEATYNENKWRYVIATEWKGYYGIFQLLFYVNFREEFDDVIFGDFYFEVGETHDNFGFAPVSYYEVIGNIHENKDLLDEKVL